MNLLQSAEHQISQILKSIYDSIKNFLEHNMFKKIYFVIETLTDFEIKKNRINIKLNEAIELNKLYFKHKSYDDINNTNNEINNLFEKLKEFEETINMFCEENKHYIVIANDISNKTIGDIICELSNLTEKNNKLYLYFDELKKDLPYFYQFANLIKIKKISDTYYSLPYITSRMIEDITKSEISRIKFKI